MRRYAPLAIGLAIGLLVGAALLVRAFPDGPDGDIYGTGYFEITVEEDMNHANPPPLPKDSYERERFNLVDGWDFGDRTSYRCAWVEYFQAGTERFEIHYELVAGYPFDLQINDRFGAEIENLPKGDPTLDNLCGIPGPASPAFDGSDHFPHLIHPGDGLVFYEDGEPMLDPQGDPVVLDLTKDQCSKSYWVPGDQPGEAWLWWDEDGPTFSHGEGEGELPCGGGPAEPVAVAQVLVRNADPDIGYCTHSLHEEQCFNNEPPPTPVQLGAGRSLLTCPDGSTPAVESTEPLLVAC